MFKYKIKIYYTVNKRDKKYTNIINILNKLIYRFFYVSTLRTTLNNTAKVLISRKINYTMLPNKLIISIIYYKDSTELNKDKINKLGQTLTKVSKIINGRGVELRLIRIHYPYLDSSILSQILSINTNFYNFSTAGRGRMLKLLLDKIAIVSRTRHSSHSNDERLPFYLTGIKMQLNGRIPTQRSIPRKTSNSTHLGYFANLRSNPYSVYNKNYFKNVLNSPRLADNSQTRFNQMKRKNRIGAYSIKV